MSAFGFGDPCLPTRVDVAPVGPQWVHEIKHDGYRLMVGRTPSSVRICTRTGYDWSDRFPLIIEAASRLRATSFVLDGEACAVPYFERRRSTAARALVNASSFVGAET